LIFSGVVIVHKFISTDRLNSVLLRNKFTKPTGQPFRFLANIFN
jgi:hypothetical protein